MYPSVFPEALFASLFDQEASCKAEHESPLTPHAIPVHLKFVNFGYSSAVYMKDVMYAYLLYNFAVLHHVHMVDKWADTLNVMRDDD